MIREGGAAGGESGVRVAATEGDERHRAGRRSRFVRERAGARGRKAEVILAVAVVFLVAATGWSAWEVRALRARNNELEAEVAGAEAELARVAGKAAAVRKRAEAQALASGGWPAEPAADASLRSASEELAALERLIPRLEATGTEAGRDPARSAPLSGSYWISSGMGWREDPKTGKLRYHPGLDLAAAKGTPVVAAAPGTVLWAGRYPKEKSAAWWNHGNLVVLRHGETVTLYAHLDEVEVVRGTQVVRGQTLGSVGTTGVTTGPHLHYEVRRSDESGVYMPVDPREVALR